MGLALRLFGVPGIRLDERELSIGLSGKALALLAYLALAAPALVSRSKLAGLLWPDKAEEAASYRLRHTLWEVRKNLGANDTDQQPRWLGADDTHCWLNLDADARVDVVAFGRGVTEAAANPTCLADTVALYRGDLLDGLNLRDAPLFDEWLLVERERWQLAYLDALWRLARLQQAAADDTGAERTFQRLIAADPLRERSYRGLMGLHHRRGERAAALRIYQQCVRTPDLVVVCAAGAAWVFSPAVRTHVIGVLPGEVINDCDIKPGAQCPNAELSTLTLSGRDLSGANLQWPNSPFYQIKIGTSGYCLDVGQAATNAGATVIAHACRAEDNANQLWRVDALGDGGYRLINRRSGLCAAPKDGGKTNDTVTVQLPCTNAQARLWGLHMQ